MPYVVWPIKNSSNPREVQESKCNVCSLLCETSLLRYKSHSFQRGHRRLHPFGDLTGVTLQFLKSATVLCLVTQSCLTLCNPMDCNPSGSSAHGDSRGKNTGVGCHFLLQGIFPTQGSTQVSHIAGRFFTV